MSPARKSASDSFNEIVTVRIELVDSHPLIWREVEVPTSVTLKVLHDIIQAAMGWFDYHLWEFTVGGKRYGLPMDEDWGTEPRREAGKVRLRDVLGSRKTIIDYLYDFGDGWEHRLIVTDVRAGQPDLSYPRYIGGEWNAPPEDCGGIPGFYDCGFAIIPVFSPKAGKRFAETGSQLTACTTTKLVVISSLSSRFRSPSQFDVSPQNRSRFG